MSHNIPAVCDVLRNVKRFQVNKNVVEKTAQRGVALTSVFRRPSREERPVLLDAAWLYTIIFIILF